MVVHACSHGIYIPPFPLLRKEVTNNNRFICNDTKTGDLPQRFDRQITYWARTIARGLIHCNTGISRSRIKNLNGLATLYALVKQFHPYFIQRPMLLIRNRPKQKSNESLQQYFDRYQDYLKMEGMIKDEAGSLGDPNEQDYFVDGAFEKEYLENQLSLERNIPENKDNFTFTNFVPTLERYLAEKQLSNPKTKRNPYIRRAILNQLEEDLDTDSDIEDIDTSPSQHINPTILKAVLTKVKANPKSAENPTCIVCRIINPDDADHPFSRCKLLKNHEHCQDMYKEGMKFVRRSLNLQRRGLQLPEATETATINAIKANIEEDATQDFQEGNNEKKILFLLIARKIRISHPPRFPQSMIPPSYHQHFIQVSIHQHLLQDDRHLHRCLLRISIVSISANAARSARRLENNIFISNLHGSLPMDIFSSLALPNAFCLK